MPSPFPCSPVIREWSWKKTQIEKKQKKNRSWHKNPKTDMSVDVGALQNVTKLTGFLSTTFGLAEYKPDF